MKKSVIMNYITLIDTGLPVYAKKFSRNGFDIIMEAWPMECTLLDEIDEESLEIYLIDIYVKENEQAIMNISLAHLEKNQLKSNYDDLLWTMENGFSEVGKIVDNRINSEKLQDIKWTKENLEKWKILLDEHSRMHILQYPNEEQFVKMRTNIEGGALCNDYEMRTISECEVEKIDESFIYWFRNTGKTIKLKDASEEVCVVDVKDEYRKKIKIVFANKKLKRIILVLLF